MSTNCEFLWFFTENIPNNYRLNVRLTFPKLRAMSDKEVTIDEIFELLNNLNSADRKRVREMLNGTRRRYRKNYDKVIKSVGDHLLKHGSITSREAHELSYTSEELHATTFRRCVIEKLKFKVQKRQLKDRRVCYYLPGVAGIEEFNSIDSKLVLSIVNSIDLTGDTVNLSAVLSDVKKYPILEEKKNLVTVTPMIINEMARRNWDMISPDLDFVKRRD